MNFPDPTRDEAQFMEWRRRAFPYFEHKIFFAHAGVSPLPRVVSDAIIEYSNLIAQRGQFDHEVGHFKLYKRCKQRIADLIGHGATPDEIAFASSTSHAIGLVATGIHWKAGDNCIVADGDFPANVITWKNLEHTHNIELRTIPHRPQMNLSLDDIKPLVNERTRVVSLASANFLSGYPINLEEIEKWLRSQNILFCVDAIQTLGAIRPAAQHVDFLCADAHKWMLGPNGIAFLWARREAMQQMRPAILGWLAVENRENWFEYDTNPINNAERFEPGARNYLGIAALDAALKLYEDTGPQWIENRVVELRDYAFQVLTLCGCPVLWEPESEKKAGILSFQAPRGETTKLFRALDDQFALSLRKDKAGQDWIRLAAHWMNTTSDIDQLGETIQKTM